MNKKGITLVEIIISVSLISIVLLFLFNLLIQVNNENSDNEVKSSYLVNQATFIKQIEEDFLEYEFKSGSSSCTVIKSSGTTSKDKLYLPKKKNNNIKCLKFIFGDTTYSYAYLFLYEREDNKTILSYYRGDFKQSVELEEFNWSDNTYSVSASNLGNEYAFSLPIIGPNGNDYSINLSYYKNT